MPGGVSRVPPQRGCRVGKTFLVLEFFGEAIRLELTGMHGLSLVDQLENFAAALGQAKYPDS